MWRFSLSRLEYPVFALKTVQENNSNVASGVFLKAIFNEGFFSNVKDLVHYSLS